ncbi:MAG: hypothetical protein ACLGI3_00095 [Actinomycetes bacterium]
MWIALLLIALALLAAGVGLVVSALKWVLIIAAVLFIAGALAGWTRRKAA